MKRIFFSLGLSLILTSFLPQALQAGECGGAYRCQEALVKFSRRLGPDEVQRLLDRNRAVILQAFPLTQLYLISFPQSQDTLPWITAFRKQLGVLIAAPNEEIQAQTLPDDPDFDLAWGLKNSGQTGGVAGIDIGIDSVWNTAQDGDGIIVAVIDTGIDYQHPDLAANIWTNPGEIPGNGIDDDGNGYVDDIHGYDFSNNDGDPTDDHQHGTHVTGILGAVGNNGVGVSGVVWTARIMALKFLNQNASGAVSNAIAAIEYALANGAQILNNSWGSSSYNAALQSAILEADSQGALFVAAAGNQHRDIESSPFYPASFALPNVVTVASIDHDDKLSAFSNFGAFSVDLAAPGGAIFSTKPGNTYGYISGTSMSTPYVAGAAALLWTEFPTLNHRQIRNLLLQGVEPRSYLAGRTVTGGMLDVASSVAIAQDPSNQIPVANAGSDRSLELGEAVTLNGSASDADGDSPLSFDWELVTPPGSRSRFDAFFSQNPIFVPDMEGDYTASLVVSDSLSQSVPDSVTITVAGGVIPLPQVLISGTFQTDGRNSQDLSDGAAAPTGSEVTLDGKDSSSIFPEELLFNWEIVAKPSGSLSSLSATDKGFTRLIPDLAGTYTVRLRIEDGYNENFGEFSFAALETTNSSPSPQPQQPSQPNSQNSVGGCSLSLPRTSF